ncbi:hypothetical protein Q6251_31895, partial [Klebsiella quasipneumoniae]|nr:hypothetical protein [Klebsiella quasipneumoniae]
LLLVLLVLLQLVQQLAKMVLYVFGAIIIVATLIDRSPLLLLSGLGVGRHVADFIKEQGWLCSCRSSMVLMRESRTATSLS